MVKIILILAKHDLKKLLSVYNEVSIKGWDEEETDIHVIT